MERENEKLENCSENIIGPLLVTDLLTDGGAVARWNGKVVFLDAGAVPGDTVLAAIYQDKKNILKASIVEHVTLSSSRVEPWCPHFSVCGGCTWQNISLTDQRIWKKKHVEETLRRIGKLEIPVADISYAKKEKNFRTKVSYAFTYQEETIRVGLKQRNSSSVISMESCPLQSALAAEAIKEVLFEINNLGAFPEDYLRFLVVHTPEYHIERKSGETSPQVVIEIITGLKHHDEHYRIKIALEKIINESQVITGILHGERSKHSDIAQSERIVAVAGESDILELYGNTPFSFPYNGFMQTNTEVARLLYDKVKELVSNSALCQILDIYCGVGTIGLHVAGEATCTLIGIESHSFSVDYAQKNARKFSNIRAKFFKGVVERFLKEVDTVDPQNQCNPEEKLIIVDPPRAGIAKPALEKLKNTQTANTMIYISCDVATQARDTKFLCEGGWSAVSAFPFDMFPYTPHVENIILLKKRK